MNCRYLLSIFFCLCLAYGQEQYNVLAIDGQQLAPDSGPYYFIDQGNSRDAYAKARPLAEALGLGLSYDNERQELVFTRQSSELRYAVSSDLGEALSFSPNVITINNQVLAEAKPKAILLADISYVPITPIGLAFGYEVNFDSTSLTLHLTTTQAIAVPPIPAEATTPVVLFELSEPRFGSHDDKTRLVLDIPADIQYSMAVKDNTFVLSFVATSAPDFYQELVSEHIQRVRYVQQPQQLDVVVQGNYNFSETGQGYAIGFIPAEDGGLARLYVDFANHLQGPPSSALTTHADYADLAMTAATPGASTNNALTTNSTLSTPLATAPVAVKRVVVLDPGHGGRFAGARGFVAEEVIVLDVALKVKALLEAKGYEVVMTRTSNTHLSDTWQDDLRARTALANTGRNIFVSIHANSFANGSPHGIETYVFGQPLDEASRQAAIRENGGGAVGRLATDSNIEFANSIMGDFIAGEKLRFSSQLAEAVQSELITTTGAYNRGVKQNPYTVLRFSPIPAVLIELGFVTHPEEGVRLGTENYQLLLAEAIANGIGDFFEQNGTLAKN